MKRTHFPLANVGWQQASFLQVHHDPCNSQREVGQVGVRLGSLMCHGDLSWMQNINLMDALASSQFCEIYRTPILHGHDLLDHH